MDNDKIDKIIKKHQGRINSLIQILLEIQHKNQWLSHEVLDKVSEKLKVPLSRIRQIVTFHKTFSLIPKGRKKVQVCKGPACHIRGSKGQSGAEKL